MQEDNNFFIELWNSILSQLKDKLSSPLLAPFLFSWFAFNHEFLIVFFGDGSIGKKVGYLHTELYKSISAFGYTLDYQPLVKLSYWLIIPLTSSLIFLLLYPFIAKFAIKRWMNWEKNKSIEIMNGKGKIPIPEELKIELQGKIKELHDRNKKLMKSNSDLYQTILEHQSIIENLNKTLSKRDKNIENQMDSKGAPDNSIPEIEPYQRSSLFDMPRLHNIMEGFKNETLSSDQESELHDLCILELLDATNFNPDEDEIKFGDKFFKLAGTYNEIWKNLLSDTEVNWAFIPKDDPSFKLVTYPQSIILELLHSYGGVSDSKSLRYFYIEIMHEDNFDVVVKQLIQKEFIIEVQTDTEIDDSLDYLPFYRLSPKGISYNFFNETAYKKPA
ncbi:hypothetical protein ACQKP8_18590 [Photobacterium alginatilyticum]|uniref:hypothetical protein n=1 Tax=Photobacterium alginatilyticum TaxID=1775171 RepID=UPI00406978AF